MNNPFVQAMNEGVARHRQGRFAEARRYYDQALKIKPGDPDALNLTGLALFQGREAEKAIDFFRRAIAVRSFFPDAHLNLGSVLATLKRFDEAIASFETAALQAPDNANAHYNLGLTKKDRKELDEAIAHLARALELAPQHLGALMTLGSIHAERRRFAKAEECFQKVVALRPDYPEAHLNLANALNEQEKYADSLAVYDRALALNPKLAKAHLGAGMALLMSKQVGAAAEAFRAAADRDPSLVDAHVQLANALNRLERFPEAAEAAGKALAVAPDHWEALLNMGISLFQMERLAEAEPYLDRALALQPLFPDAYNVVSLCKAALRRTDAAIALLQDGLAKFPDDGNLRLNLALSQLMAGRLAEGWGNLAGRWATAQQQDQRRVFSMPGFTGRPEELAGKSVLLWAEQGVGDIFSYVSALPDLGARAGKVVFEAPDKIVPILGRSFPSIKVRPIDSARDGERGDCDCHIPVGDLFGLLRPNLDSFATDRHAYLVAEPNGRPRRRAWLDGLGPGLKVGIGWRSSVVTPSRLRHFFADLMPWQPILSQAGVQFIVLQPGDVEAEVAQAEAAFGITLHRPPGLDLYDDIEGLSSLLAELDLVVSNGSALAIQAAAQGVPTWMFFLRNAHWDLLGTEGVPWLPALRVFARDWGEGWEGAVEAVARTLGERIAVKA